MNIKKQLSLLEVTESYLRTSVAPQASEIDRDPQLLLQAMKGMGELNLLALRIPQEWGGAGASEEIYQSCQELVARYSGALAFLQVQHQSASGMILAGKNSLLMDEFLSRMSRGKILVGVGFSQVRRAGKPLTVAKRVDGGYLLNGEVPWITGWGLFDKFIIAAVLPDGKVVLGMLPFIETVQNSGGKITFSAPMELAGMESTNTVTASLTNWFLPAERVVAIQGEDWIHDNDRKNVLRATCWPLGCARAGLDIIASVAENKPFPFIKQAWSALDRELLECRSAIREAQQNPDLELTEKQQLRAWAIELSVRCAHAAITVSSGAANYSHHAAQRVYREALVFTVTAQTTGIMEATLARLIRPAKIDRAKNISYSKVIDLSHAIDPNIPQWPGDPPVEFATVAELETDGYYLRRFSLGEHSATHINAPNSFHPDGIGIDRYPANSLVVPAVVIDIRDKANANSNYTITIADILAWENQHGVIPADNLVILYTGWQEKWSDPEAFLGRDGAGCLHFPGFSSEATKFLIEQRQIAGVGIDTHGVDPGESTTFSTNFMVLQEPRIVLENLTNLDKLPPKGATLAIGILRLKGGSGSPASVLALF